jgi:hypothetical protein
VTQEDLAKYSGLSLTELRKKREELISDLNFEEVGVVDQAIKSFNTDNTQKVVETLIEKLEEQANAVFDWYDKAEALAKESCQQTQQRARVDAEKQLKDATAAHDKILRDLETERSLELSRNEIRPSIRSLECLKKAKQLARFENVESAIAMRELAEQRLNEHRKERVNAIEQSFEKLTAYENEKYDKEVHLIQRNLKLAFGLAAQKRQENVDVARRRAAAQIREDVRKAVSSGVKKLERPEKHAVLAASLRGYVKGKVAKEGREYIFTP